MLHLLVPRLVVDEFERNRDRVEMSMTESFAQRFKLIKQDLDDYGGSDNEQALKVITDLGASTCGDASSVVFQGSVSATLPRHRLVPPVRAGSGERGNPPVTHDWR